MDKNAIKKYAVWARRELISRVSQKALQYGITEDNIEPATVTSVNSVVLSNEEIKQRKALIDRINEHGYQQVMEEVAYTWFNRFSALRFMEVNGYLPSHVRVFTDEENNFKPQILSEAINLELDGLDMEKVYALKDANDNDALFKYLVIVQCNALNPILPGMFQRISDYTELLFPDNLLREGSVIQQMIELIPEEDWKDAVQIIGWLYQYYNIETFDSIYDGDMSRSKVTKDLLPAATELFTPDWVVRYMVENSLGRFWIEGHPNKELQSSWKFYMNDVEQESSVQTALAEISKKHAAITPEQIKCIDPCSGSGHICVYMFDVLMQIYEKYGYTAREAVRSIVENNIYGLDIDERAAQLAYFSVMMKARQYDKRFLTRKDEDGKPDVPQPHVYEILESNGLDRSAIDHFIGGNPAIKKAINSLISEMHDAKEYGSILNITPVDFDALYKRFDEVLSEPNIFNLAIKNDLLPFVKITETMAQKYDVAVTNPPYLGNSRFNPQMSEFVKRYYPDEKADLAMAMLNKIVWGFTRKDGYAAAITTVSWMYLKSFEKFRIKMISQSDFVCLADFGTELFEGKVGHLPVAAWVSRNSTIYSSMPAVRLVDYCYSRRDEKEIEFFNPYNHHTSNQKDYKKIPGSPIAYWASKEKISAFEIGTLVDDIASVKIGMGTGKNDIFVREWWEIPYAEIDFSLTSIEQIEDSNGVFFPYNKGGDYRRWYGNLQEVVWYNAEGRKKMFSMSGHRENGGKDGYFKEGITWNFIGATKFGARLMPCGCLFDVAGSALFVDKEELHYVFGFLMSSACNEILKILNPTVNYQAGNIKSLPVIFEKESIVDNIVRENILESRDDWDSFETSWDFRKHPLVPTSREWAEQRNSQFADTRVAKFSQLAWHYEQWEQACKYRFDS